MSIVLLASATGSPGVTTNALGLSLTWPSDVLLVDVDRDPAQAVQAGYLRGVDLAGRGMLAIARAHRESHALAPEVWQQAIALTNKGEPERRFLPGFAHPGMPGLFQPVWPELATAFAQLSDGGVDVIVDAGRIGEGLPPPLLTQADLVLVCVRSSLRGLAALRLHLPALLDQVASLPGRAEVGLVLVGENRPYSAREVSGQFGVEVWFATAWDEVSAAVLIDGEPESKRFAEQPLLRSLRSGASRIADRLRSARLERAGQRGAS